MAAKAYLTSFLLVTLLGGNIWLLQKDRGNFVEAIVQNREETTRLSLQIAEPLDTRQLFSAPATSPEHTTPIPTPDELFDQQQMDMRTNDELAPTIVDRVVVSDALKLLEQQADDKHTLVNLDIEVELADNSDNLYAAAVPDLEIPASGEYKPVVDFNLAEMENQSLELSDSDPEILVNYPIIGENP